MPISLFVYPFFTVNLLCAISPSGHLGRKPMGTFRAKIGGAADADRTRDPDLERSHLIHFEQKQSAGDYELHSSFASLQLTRALSPLRQAAQPNMPPNATLGKGGLLDLLD